MGNESANGGDNDYEVGYKRPPKANQFRKGQSGNPKGRKKGVRNLMSDVRDEFGMRISLNEGGSKIRVTKQRGMIKSLAVKAIKGDTRAMNLAIQLMLRMADEDADKAIDTVVSKEDEAIIAAFLSRNHDFPFDVMADNGESETPGGLPGNAITSDPNGTVRNGGTDAVDSSGKENDGWGS